MESAAQKSVEKRRQALPPAIERGARARWWRWCGSKQRGFWYVDATGQRITDEAQRERIRALVIPPAWSHVRIAPSPRSRLQAIGVDTSGRVQYQYQARFAACQQRKKYAKIERFGAQLPQLRRLTNEHIVLEGFPSERVLAVIVQLINNLFFRVGSEASVERYRTYGVTTLRNRHLQITADDHLVFRFTGKHHIPHRRLLVDAELAELMRQVKALRGPRLFNYLDGEGKVHPITPRDVNRYIHSAIGPEFSAKDFRTWGGTLQAAIALVEIGKPSTEKQAKRNIAQAMKRVAERLGNTPTVCRSCYVHPIVMERYLQGITLDDFRPKSVRAIRRVQPDYEPEEWALLKLFCVEAAEGKATESAASL